MTLPEYISNFFSNISSGITNPLIEGIYSIFPALVILGFIFSFIGLFFQRTRVPSLVTLLLCVFLCATVPSMGEFVQSIFNWFGATNVDMTSASEAARQGTEEGMTAIQALQ